MKSRDETVVIGKMVVIWAYAIVLIVRLVLFLLVFFFGVAGHDQTHQMFWMLVGAVGLMAASLLGWQWATKLLLAGVVLGGFSGLITAVLNYDNFPRFVFGVVTGVTFLGLAGVIWSRPARAFFASKAHTPIEG